MMDENAAARAHWLLVVLLRTISCAADCTNREADSSCVQHEILATEGAAGEEGRRKVGDT